MNAPSQPLSRLLPDLVVLDKPKENGSDEVSAVEILGRTQIQQDRSNDWLLWQIADSAFPTGGFAHSGGLEAAWQQGEINSPEELFGFIQVHLAQIGRAALPFANEAFHKLRPFAEIDKGCDVFLSNHVANRGSRAQGQAFLWAAEQAFSSKGLTDFRAEVLKLPGHFAPVFGAVLRHLNINHTACLRLFSFMGLRALLASAVRLGIIGPMAAQSLQARLVRDAENTVQRSSGLRMADAAQISPLLDILQGAHDRLYSRLFQT
jgi:urease accessory protein